MIIRRYYHSLIAQYMVNGMQEVNGFAYKFSSLRADVYQTYVLHFPPSLEGSACFLTEKG